MDTGLRASGWDSLAQAAHSLRLPLEDITEALTNGTAVRGYTFSRPTYDGPEHGTYAVFTPFDVLSLQKDTTRRECELAVRAVVPGALPACRARAVRA